MIATWIYTDPYGGQEILCLDGEPRGVAYDPRRTTSPVPWRSECPHCTRGRLPLGIHLKREVQMLATRQIIRVPSLRAPVRAYVVPTNDHPHVLRHWRCGDTQHARVIDELDREVVQISQTDREKMLYSSAEVVQSSAILKRCLRFLFSERAATPTEIRACVEPLAASQASRLRRRGHRNACDKIDWPAVLEEVI
jgi:hypothetical protein